MSLSPPGRWVSLCRDLSDLLGDVKVVHGSFGFKLKDDGLARLKESDLGGGALVRELLEITSKVFSFFYVFFFYT